jgi:hypothetical protein
MVFIMIKCEVQNGRQRERIDQAKKITAGSGC